jgi:two-component system sensor histidine kinase QseC
MENTIEQLLALYKLTPENFGGTLTSCKVQTMLREALVERYDEMSSRNQTAELLGDEVEIEADFFALSVLIKNLLDNCIKYTPNDGRVRVKVKEVENSHIGIEFEDSGPGISDDDKPHVFDRFFRVGQDRHNSGVIGSGLGLSIVAHVVNLHHGTIKLFDSKDLGGLGVTVVLPIEQPSGIGHRAT